MQSSFYVSLSGQVALNKRLETLSGNIANAGTTGYRADVVSFDSIFSSVGKDRVAFASSGQTTISRTAGSLTKTDNPLDVAAQGTGWFGIQTANGTVYTRDGRMQMRETGELTTLNNNPVLDVGGSGILLDPTAGPPQISRDGMITQGGRQVGAIGLFQLDPTAKLSRAENSGVISDKPATPVLDFVTNGVAQGFQEGSNVNPVLEMTKLIAVQRAFESLTTSVESSESSLQDAIKTLGSTS